MLVEEPLEGAQRGVVGGPWQWGARWGLADGEGMVQGVGEDPAVGEGGLEAVRSQGLGEGGREGGDPWGAARTAVQGT